MIGEEEERDSTIRYQREDRSKPLFIRKFLGNNATSPPITRDIEDKVMADLALFALSRDHNFEPINGRDHVVDADPT